MEIPFQSRAGLIDNLHGHLSSGGSAAMIGGPKIGKSVLAGNLADRIDRGSDRAVRINLREVEKPDDLWPTFSREIQRQALGPEEKTPFKKSPCSLSDLMFQLHHFYEKAPTAIASRPVILLLDNCERFFSFPLNLIPQILNLSHESMAPSIKSVCWIGGVTWGDWVSLYPDLFKSPLRLYPLSVIPIREARKIIQEQLGPDATREQIDQLWHETGGHPLLLEKAFRKECGASEDLVRALWAELGPEEKAILAQLDPAGKWKPLDVLKGVGGAAPPKARFDRLCALGLVVRTLMDGTASIRLTSPQFAKGKDS